MKSVDIKNKLSEILIKLDQTYTTLNCGGCGAFAKVLGDVLKKKGHKVKYLLVLAYKPHVEIANQYTNKNKIPELNRLNWTHIMTIVDGKLVDSEGVFNKLNDRYKSGGRYGVKLPEKTLNDWLSPEYKSNWNPIFDRKLIPKIKKELDKSLVD